MKILYIIGNGLDMAFHMNTSYQDFFNYYLDIASFDEEILSMKRDIESHKFETWADLEIGLGNYSMNCPNKAAFLKCLFDIKDNLKAYLRNESEKIGNYRINSVSGFVSPEHFLDPEPKLRYNSYRKRFNQEVEIDVITLNYTLTLETLLNYKNKPEPIAPMVIMNSLHHIHGTLDNMMVMGVNDTSQVKNLLFNTDLDVVEDFVKPEYNDACMNNKNHVCESLVNEANIIVLYGSSLGPSDDRWWKLIGKRMSSENYPLLVYLPYDKKKDQSAEPNHLRRWTKEYVNVIRDRFDIKIDEIALANRICIAVNKRLFPISKAIQNPKVV